MGWVGLVGWFGLVGDGEEDYGGSGSESMRCRQEHKETDSSEEMEVVHDDHHDDHHDDDDDSDSLSCMCCICNRLTNGSQFQIRSMKYYDWGGELVQPLELNQADAPILLATNSTYINVDKIQRVSATNYT